MSQHFANFYLGNLDRYVKERLRIPGYVRYMDDMLLWSNDRGQLENAIESGKVFLAGELGLALKPGVRIRATRIGIGFLGCRVFPRYMILNRRSRRRYSRKLASLDRALSMGDISEREMQDRVTALVAFTRTEGVSSWRFRQRTLGCQRVSGR